MDPETAKALTDRLYEKRRTAAQTIEKTVRQLLAQNRRESHEQIGKIIEQLCQDYAYAVLLPSARNGGLIGLAAVAIALGSSNIAQYLDQIITPVLACFSDQSAQVRYYACEALYNIAKVAKGEILVYFNDVFDVLCRLFADSQASVKNGANLFNRLIKDIVAEKAATYVSVVHAPRDPHVLLAQRDQDGYAYQQTPEQQPHAFLLSKFIPVLKERLFTGNPYTRLFLVEWIVLLDLVPDLELVGYLPNFLGGLLLFLADSNKDVRVATARCLQKFLDEIVGIVEVKKIVEQNRALKNESVAEEPESGLEDGLSDILDLEDVLDLEDSVYLPYQDVELNLAEIVRILIANLDKNEEIILVVLNWLETLLDLTPLSFIPLVCDLVGVLVSILLAKDASKNTKERVKSIDVKLMEVMYLYLDVTDSDGKDAAIYTLLVSVITDKLLLVNETTKLQLLDWLLMLHKKLPGRFLGTNLSKTFQILLKSLCDELEAAIAKDLALILAMLQEAPDARFGQLSLDLVALFRNDKNLLETKANFIIRKLCTNLSAERIYKLLAAVLFRLDTTSAGSKTLKNTLGFISVMIQILNSNLVTAPELSVLRKKLSNLDTKEDWELFETLFKLWSYNAPGCLLLCLLSQNYELAYNLLQIFVDFEILVNLLVQLDILVQLLESPVFVRLRLQLLEPEKHPYLLRCLYGILMLLPQLSAFTTLHRRLDLVRGFGGGDTEKESGGYEELRQVFREVQKKHEGARLEN